MTESSSSDGPNSNGLWSLLPTFDPAVDEIREYVGKAQFLAGICPKKDKPMLAPRLAMGCKGTAWSQVKQIKSELLVDPDNGVKHLLSALASWEESAELKTFELFEKALYKVTQKQDETTASFVNRLAVAFDEVGETTTLKEVKAFILLRQSALNNEDKKKVLAMTSGVMEFSGIEQAMRNLSTKVLTSQGEPKKKIYPTNYVEEEVQSQENPEDAGDYALAAWEEEEISSENVEALGNQGDQDALTVMNFEKDLEDLLQDIPDFQQAYVTYPRSENSEGFGPQKAKASRRANMEAKEKTSCFQELPAHTARHAVKKGIGKQSV